MLGEIRRTKRSGLYGGLAAAAGCLVAWIIFGREGMTFAVGAVFFAMYGVLTDRNDRMAYMTRESFYIRFGAKQLLMTGPGS